MEKLQNNIDRESAVLKAVGESELSVGAIYLSEKLGIPSASVGRILTNLEKRGFLKKESNKGRRITSEGKKYLEEKNILDAKISAAHTIIKAQLANNISALKEILEVRRLIEGYGVMRCSENCSDSEAEELEEIQREYTAALKSGNTGSEQDLKLHLKIAEFSKNVTLANLLKLVLTDNSSYESFSQAAMYKNRLDLDEHGKIIDAIKNRDAKRAKREMENHLKRVMENTLGCI